MIRKLFTRNASGLIAAVLLLFAVLGCSRISNAIRESTSESDSYSAEDAGADETSGDPVDGDRAIAEKTNLYIGECYNSYSNRVIESYNRYASWIEDIDRGPTGNERLIYGLYDTNGDGVDCADAVTKAAEMDPDLPEVESAAAKYAEALAGVIKQIRRVNDYYEREDYKDDEFQLGKKAHPDLIAAFKEFRSANDEFGKRVDELEDRVAALQLEKLKDVPDKRFEYVVIDSGLEAKKFRRLLENKPFEELSADELQPLVDGFEGTIQELKKEATGAMSGMYISECENFLKANKELLRRVRDKKKFSNIEQIQISSGAGWMVEGSPQKVIWYYNQMVQRKELLRF